MVVVGLSRRLRFDVIGPSLAFAFWKSVSSIPCELMRSDGTFDEPLGRPLGRCSGVVIVVLWVSVFGSASPV